ncbi:integrase arm-type DNA-binding domain-containing protein [Planktotalea arctica]|uniref:integrase arm-type DNA-binding domain-containing protein n=1 Tax=Planktotalea arctica TaxID=1481893 RepID=UPI00321BBB01
MAVEIADLRKRTPFSLGGYPEVSLGQARKAKEAARAKVAAGIDPSEAKQGDKRLRFEAKGQTFEKLVPAFLANQRKDGRSAAKLSKTEDH